MPTQKPRITVTLSEHVYETINRMAEITGQSRGALLAELVESVHPPLMRTVALLEAARDAPEEVRRGLKGSVERVERELRSVADAGIQQQDWLLGEIARQGADPRPSNHGGQVGESQPARPRKQRKSPSMGRGVRKGRKRGSKA